MSFHAEASHTEGYGACCSHPWISGVIPCLLPDEWMLEQNKEGKMPEEECRPILLQKEEDAKLGAGISFQDVMWFTVHW